MQKHLTVLQKIPTSGKLMTDIPGAFRDQRGNGYEAEADGGAGRSAARLPGRLRGRGEAV